MPPTHFDVIVAGLGAMGSATAARLALRGQKVLGLDRWRPGHPYGSSHGDSRIIREMYFENPLYVPLVQRAHELWRELEHRTGIRLMEITGGLMIGPEHGGLVRGTLRSAQEHVLPCEVLNASQVAERFPAFRLRDGDIAVFDPRAGYLNPEAGNAAHLRLAAEEGADLRFEEPVESWRPLASGVEVTTQFGVYSGARLVLSAGARNPQLLGELDLHLEVERQAVFWLEPGADPAYESPAMPIWAHEYVPGEICYGFPRLARGVKASVMHSGEIVSDAASVNREVGGSEVEPLRRALATVLPGLAKARVLETDVCLFTNTRDRDFIIDFHPEYPQVLISSACSGHGFKFASAVGETQAELITDGASRFDVSPFRMSRVKLR
jgi:sarcosine oxidase